MYALLDKHYPKYNYKPNIRNYDPNCLLPAERFEIMLKTDINPTDYEIIDPNGKLSKVTKYL